MRRIAANPENDLGGIPVSEREKRAFKQIRDNMRIALNKIERIFRDELEKLQELVKNDELEQKVQVVTQQVETFGDTLREDLIPYITTELMGKSKLSDVEEEDRELGKELEEVERKEREEEVPAEDREERKKRRISPEEF
jgi:hypothetical protein